MGTIQVSEWSEGAGWRQSNVPLESFSSVDATRSPQFISPETQVFVIFPSADQIRKNLQYQKAFVDCFHIPDVWCSNHLGNANGYFGCEATRDEGSITGFNSWVFFEAKFLKPDMDYYWSKVNIFTRWLPATKQTGILLFDPTPDLSIPLFRPESAQLRDPFWVYSNILQEVARIQEDAVWAIRDHVRGIEKTSIPSDSKPQPRYRRLHDIARHAIHVTESLDVAVQNVDHIIRQHELYATLWTVADSSLGIRQSPSFQDTSSRLSFFQSHIESIRHRSISNQKRLQNEIQLAFNIVSQHDTKLTVDISAAARSDSATMKTLAFVTLTFLPPTFISAIFSMSFFNYDRDLGWAVSDKIWLYWVFAVPITLATALLWLYWHKFFPQHAAESPRDKEKFDGLPTHV